MRIRDARPADAVARIGVGAGLLARACAWLAAAGHPRAVLWVAAGNDRARAFYAAQGWWADGAEQTDEVHGVVVDELRYRRDLGPHG